MHNSSLLLFTLISFHFVFSRTRIVSSASPPNYYSFCLALLGCLLPSLMNSLYAIWISKSISGSSSSSTKSSDSSLKREKLEKSSQEFPSKLTRWCHQCWLDSLRACWHLRIAIPPRWWFVRRGRRIPDYRCSSPEDGQAARRAQTAASFHFRLLKIEMKNNSNFARTPVGILTIFPSPVVVEQIDNRLN